MKIKSIFTLLTCVFVILLTVTQQRLARAQEGGTITRVSVASDGTQGNGYSDAPSISADGRYVAFESWATNLVAGDINDYGDVFVRDRQTGQTTRVSVASDGTQGNDSSYAPSISADGRYVAFVSNANNLVRGDTNGTTDIFVHDRQTGQTTRVSVASGGTQGNLESYTPDISADGRYVAFESFANNLVRDTNGSLDIFVHDRQTGQTTRISVASDGTQGNEYSYSPSISADGHYVAFYSDATNLVTSDTNDYGDVFVRDRQTGQTTRVSVASDGTQGNDYSCLPRISADGHYVAFYSDATNLVTGDTNDAPDVFVRDRQTGQTTRVSVASDGTQGNDISLEPSISADGRFVTFESAANNFIAGDTNGFQDIFVHDRQTGQTTRVSVASDGTQGNNLPWYPVISGDGRFVAFELFATNLVTNDTNGVPDIFVYDRLSVPPAVPGLTAPAANARTRDTTPSFRWTSVSGASQYRIQVDNNSDFSSPVINVIRATTTYTPTTALSDGRYYWRLRAGDVSNLWGAWSTVRSVFIDTVPPAKPTLVSPANGATIPGNTPTLRWNASNGATKYTIQIDNNSKFSSPITNRVVTAARYTQAVELAVGRYYWRVRAQDAVGNRSAWSIRWSFRVTGGALAPGTATPTSVPSDTPTSIPDEVVVEFPTLTPTESVVDTLLRVESDQPAVLQRGVWTSHTTDVASGGSYLYSSGSFDDLLSLSFVGSQVEVMYVKHPALGTFAVEVDGAVIQLVNSVAAESEFGAQATVNGLSDGVHLLEVYPVAGVVALDAFGVEALSNEPVPTPTPTEIPPDQPTLASTPSDVPTPDVTPSELPSDQPTPTAISTPPPALLPVVETFDSGLNWLPAGAWVFDTQTAYRGAGWFADSTTRGQISTLTYGVQIDLRTSLNPELRFWYKATLSSNDAFAVYLSPDSMTWQVLDQQIGPITDWTQHTLDLTAYRGQVIALRFQLDTMKAQPEGVTTTGVWVDELVIQEALPALTPTEAPTATPTATDVSTSTLVPPTATNILTETPMPPTATSVLTATPMPTIMPSPMETPVPPETPPDIPTETPVPTDMPTDVPAPESMEGTEPAS